MIRLTLLITAALVATPSAPAWAQRAAHYGEHLKVHAFTDAPLVAIHNARAVARNATVASEGRAISGIDDRSETVRGPNPNEIRNVPSGAVSF